MDVTRRCGVTTSGKLSGVFRVLDSTNVIHGNDWDRVVAVFVSGAAWQFREWKWGNPVDALRNACGFFLKYDSDDIPQNVKKWNVRVIPISKSKRHLDGSAAEAFWAALEKFLISNKPQYCPQ